VCVSVAIESIQRINTAIDDEIKLLERRIRQLIGETYQEEYRRLLGIPGIGKRLGAAIIGYFQEFEHFAIRQPLIIRFSQPHIKETARL